MQVKSRVEQSALSDEELVQLIVQQGQSDLFGILYDRYAPLVYRKAVSLVKREALAEDLTHDIMIKIFTKLSQFEGRANFSLWVNTISYNHCMQHFRQNKRRKEEEVPEEFDVMSEDDIEAEQQELLAANVKELERCLANIKKDYSVVLSMRYYAEMSIKQMAEALEMGESAIKMRLKRGREWLASCISPAKK
ncbi:RNA polymerase sigma factor [Saprospira sp. CCB-QB6]|uniref:RNA polymerase sigma factor n=1 Tax=Saprospira sp. CCB-QB6 TaxID=3023936 RepID=UPI00234B6F30|nr:RNA polymerase sigma factor [Saprospira sp. CCB-QB6]WCL82764.1 RNA polymerase sigma factor [Saprospira sp. CCB-QB6]